VRLVEPRRHWRSSESTRSILCAVEGFMGPE
jgi:hypothetical protein